MDWRPIKTAPDDQRPILGAHARSGLRYVTWREAIGSDRYVRAFEVPGRGWKPTHWMPLPPPPEEEKR